jgi:predicted nucleic acid-binding Zn ribbon protein
MRRKNTQKLGDVVQKYLEALDIDGKLKEVRLIKSWESVVGKMISNKTNNIFIKDKKLFVYLNSSIARNELSMVKDDLVKRLNQQAGGEVIEDIVLR